MLNPKEPKYQGIYIGPDGRELTVTLLTSHSCRYNCLMCAYSDTGAEHVTDQDVLDQIKTVIAHYEHRIPEIDVFSFGNDGSILDEHSLKFDTLLHISELLGRYFPKISFETRVDFITQEKMTRLKAVLGDKLFEFAVGLETRDDYIRNTVLRKGLAIEEFEEKIRFITHNNISTKVFIILKPSPYMNEEEGIEDCVKTITYLYELGEKNGKPITIDLNPLYVHEGSEFEAIAKEQNWTSPLLWSAVEVICRTKALPVKMYIDLSSEGLPVSAVPGNCGVCDADFKRTLRRFNRHRNVERLLHELPACDCKPDFVTY